MKQRNFVAKYAKQFNKCSVYKNKKKEEKKGQRRTKNFYLSEV